MQASLFHAESAQRLSRHPWRRSDSPPRAGMRFTRGLLIGSAASGTMWILIGYALSSAL